MSRIEQFIFATAIASLAITVPAFAEPGRGNGHGPKGQAHKERRDHDRRAARAGYVADCPPGLAKKNPPCVPPGQARKQPVHYGNRVGDVLRVGDYVVIREPRRYDLETRRGWDYYRDNDRVYRVDSSTRKVLAVLNLIDAFTN
ncbi:hypothetical protein [Paracoccus benzoatiresistens]|uniref:Nickel/cobalt transporter regulator n=1 Tax=Paracoccus benzoatiresistens TaxID=2997341 RepID=A0ABT4J217_9RHOB|nr:hypothetical protein [Paracoccus sp. EF6]MCZ0960695.1 hypothetical protein [Paracoccus sp. EF6]